MSSTLANTTRKTKSHSSGIEVTLIDSMGDDVRIVNAARVSFRKESDWQVQVRCLFCDRLFRTRAVGHKFECNQPTWCHVFQETGKLFLKGADDGIINAMMRERHGTPFEKVVFEFHVRAPIGVVWEWVRHRMSSFNVASTRYVEWEKDYYTPATEDWRRQVGKPMEYKFETIDDGSEHAISVQYELAMEAAFNSYDLLLHMGLAKEVARNVLPMGAMTEFYWTVNLRSLFNFLSLRTAPNALREIRIASTMVEELASDVAPAAFAAWNTYGRKAP